MKARMRVKKSGQNHGQLCVWSAEKAEEPVEAEKVGN